MGLLCVYEQWIIWEQKIIFCCICCCKVLLINVWLHMYVISNWETLGLMIQPWYQRGLLFLLITLIFSCILWSFSLREKVKQLKFWFIRACRYVYNSNLERNVCQRFINKYLANKWITKLPFFPNIGLREFWFRPQKKSYFFR